MLFQIFDSKKECAYLYKQEQLYFKKISKDLTKTWSYSELLVDKEVEYAQLYCQNKTLDEVCPEHLRETWEKVNRKLKAFYRAIAEVGLNLSDFCLHELVSKSFLIDYGNVKNQICDYVFRRYKKPENYDYLLSLTKVLTEIKNKKLKINSTALNDQLYKFKTRQFINKVKHMAPYIIYDAHKTKTGRLSTKNSFPILTMDKLYRKILEPNNDWFLELDYNAAELRVMLALLNKEQPQEDLHKWNLKNVYRDIGTREEAKKRIFAWLYNPKSKDYLSNRAYNREELLEKYWDGTSVKTYFDRKIEADEHHALNYTIQSTAADLFLRQMIKIWEKLQDRKSYVAFCLHDSLVIDFSEEDMDILKELKKIFKDTDLGQFKVNVSVGKNYGKMGKLSI